MRKLILASPLASLVVILSICFVSFFITNACRKMDRSTDKLLTDNVEFRFFNQHVSPFPQVQAISNLLKRENDKDRFVERLVNKAGFPIWNKALIVSKPGPSTQSRIAGEDSSSTVIFIPFAKDNQQVVSAALRVTITSRGDTVAKVLYASKYTDTNATGMHPRYLSLLLMKLDNEVFGHRVFRITDSAALGGLGKNIGYVEIGANDDLNILSRLVKYTLTVCYTVTYPGYCDGQVHGVAPGENPYCTEYLCESLSWWEDDGSGGGGGGWPPPGGGGGGAGGSTGGYLNPCRALPGDPDPCAGGSGSGGWVPVEEPPLANQNIIDSLQGYPCAQQILAQLPSINDTSRAILRDIFGVNDRVNIVFKADSTLPSNVNGSAQAGGIQFDPNTGSFRIRIRLNTWVLKNSSKEFIIKTMFHEAIHAFIDYHWKKYINGLIDSTSFMQMFPKIWHYKKQPYSNLAQHTEIAHSYVNHIKSVVYSFNSTIADSTNRAISWSGLYETQAWRDLGSDTIQLNRLRVTARNGTTIEMQALNLQKCN